MKNRNPWLNLLIAIISLVLGGVISSGLITLIQYYNFFGSSLFIIMSLILGVSCALFFVFRSLVFRKFDRLPWILATILYLAIMVAVLFFKGQGRGINLNLRGFFDQWNNGSYERAYLIGNCLAFVPYPLLFYFWGLKTKSWRAFLLFLVIEGLQYVFVLGAFDVFDLVSYVVGYLVGYIILIIYIKIGVHSAYSVPKFIFSRHEKKIE